MTLDKSYLEYEHRKHGMDHELYGWSNLFDRKPVSWPDGKGVALWLTVALEYFPLTPNDGPFRAPGHMVTPYPDYRTYTTRDYGNRIGIYRILKVLKDLGLKASMPMCADIATRYPALVEDVLADGHEIVAHGVNMNDIHYGGMDKVQETEQIGEALQTLKVQTGQKIVGWISPARSQSENTLDLLTDAGFTYHGDWVNDDMPYLQSADDKSIIAMPHTMELEDRQLLVNLGQHEDVYKAQIMEAHAQLAKEAASGAGRVLHMGLIPYVIGQPWRIRTLRETLETLLDSGTIWSATGAEIATTWQDQQ